MCGVGVNLTAFTCADMSWKIPPVIRQSLWSGWLENKKKRVDSALRETHKCTDLLTHTRTHIRKYSSNIFVKAGDKHRVFSHHPWLLFLSTEWKHKGKINKKRVWEGENYRSFCHCLLMSWKPTDHIALAETVQCTQTLRHGINTHVKGYVQQHHCTEKRKTEANKPKRGARQAGFH